MPIEHPHDFEKAIQDVASYRLEMALERIDSGDVTTLDDLREAINDQPHDDTVGCYMATDDRLSALAIHGDEYGIEVTVTKPDDLRLWIEQQACALAHYLGEARAVEVVDELTEILNEHEIDLTDLDTRNPHESWRHYAERYLSSEVVIYEYRNLEGEGIHVDVHEITLPGDVKVYALKDVEDVSDAEAGWDAR